MSRFRCSLAVALLGLLAGACSSSTAKKALGDGCTINSDCSGSLACSFGRCHAACAMSKDCPSGQSCVKDSSGSLVCQLGVEAHCSANSDCGAPLTCAADGQCRGQCEKDSDCTSGQKCSTNKTCAEPSQVDSNNNLVASMGGSGAGGGGGTSASSGGASSCQPGAEACACLTDKTCNAGLTCASNLCVNLGAGGAGGAGGASSAGGSSSNGGTSSASTVNNGGTNPGGTSSTAGNQSTGGIAAIGGTSGVSTNGTTTMGGNTTSGTSSSAGTANAGGVTAAGGSGAIGGTAAVGGTAATSGTTNVGGTMSTGGTASVGGTAATGGTTGSGATTAPGTVWFVNGAGPGGDGKSWGTAFATLQAALINSLLRSGDQIWIAQGTYTPAASGGSRTTYFYLMNGVALYGGFHGTEATLADRDNPVDPSLTVLSGDLGANDGIDASGNPTNRDDNTYHVVVGAPNATLDGLTITGGNANGSATEQQQGGGLYNLSCDGMRVAHARFVWNLATGSGGGLYNAAGSYTSEKLIDVVFAKNRAGSQGGGLYNASGNATLTGVTFANNQAVNGGGMSNNSGDPVLTRTTFVGNTAVASGNPRGGGLYVAAGNPDLTNVTFGGNQSTGGNSTSPSYGGGMFVAGGAPMLTNATFVGNIASGGGAHGGGIALTGGDSLLVNVTLSVNTANANWNYDAGGLYFGGGSPKLTNALIWGNYVNSSIGEIYGSGATFSHSNAHSCAGSAAWNTSCGTDGGGNVDTATSPFVTYRAPSGSWTAAPAYSTNSLQTTFTNTMAPWAADELVGMFVQPDTSQPLRLPIVANTATTLTVWGDASSAAASGTMYSLYDVRLAVGSQCIDTGDNNSLPADVSDLDGNGNTTEVIPWDLDNRPRVVNGTVDMGAYEYQ